MALSAHKVKYLSGRAGGRFPGTGAGFPRYRELALEPCAGPGASHLQSSRPRADPTGRPLLPDRAESATLRSRIDSTRVSPTCSRTDSSQSHSASEQAHVSHTPLQNRLESHIPCLESLQDRLASVTPRFRTDSSHTFHVRLESDALRATPGQTRVICYMTDLSQLLSGPLQDRLRIRTERS